LLKANSYRKYDRTVETDEGPIKIKWPVAEVMVHSVARLNRQSKNEKTPCEWPRCLAGHTMLRARVPGVPVEFLYCHLAGQGDRENPRPTANSNVVGHWVTN
jgi:hypothetical protein